MFGASGRRRRPYRYSRDSKSTYAGRTPYPSPNTFNALILLDEPRFEAEALWEAYGVPTLRLDHAARVGQPLLVLVGFLEIQQVGFAGGLDQIRMCDVRVSHQWMSASCAARRSATCPRSWSVMACPWGPARGNGHLLWLGGSVYFIEGGSPAAANPG